MKVRGCGKRATKEFYAGLDAWNVYIDEVQEFFKDMFYAASKAVDNLSTLVYPPNPEESPETLTTNNNS